MIKLGSKNIKDIYLGGKKIARAYLGGKLVYDSKKGYTVFMAEYRYGTDSLCLTPPPMRLMSC